MNQFKEIWLPLADRFYRVAAVVVIAVGLSLFKSDNEPVDTFDDPYQAYAELEKALVMVSEGMQKGIDKTVEILK